MGGEHFRLSPICKVNGPGGPAPSWHPSPSAFSQPCCGVWGFVILECDLGSCQVEASRRDAWVPPGLVSPAWGCGVGGRQADSPICSVG